MSLSIHDHRNGFSTICPHCLKQFGNMEWFNNRVSTHRSANAEKVCVVSSCPKCSEDSWAHWGKWMIEAYEDMTVHRNDKGSV